MDVQIPYSPNVKARFRILAEVEIERIRRRTEDAITRLREQANAEVHQWRQILAHVDQEVPEPGGFTDAPDLSDDPDGLIARFVADHEAETKSGWRRP